MNISIKHYGNSRVMPSKIIEITVESDGNRVVEDVTNIKGFIDERLIQSLRNIADELEQQNVLVAQNLNN